MYELAHTDKDLLKAKLGIMGLQLYYQSWGIDYSDLTHRYVPRMENKGYGNSQVLMRDYSKLEDIETVLSEIADQVATKLRKHNVQCELISISLGFAEPDERNRTHFSAQTRIDPTNRTQDLIDAVRYLVEQKWEGNALRNVGVRAGKISTAAAIQTSLFEQLDDNQVPGALDRTIDAIRDRFGYKALTRGYSKTDGGTAIKRSGLVGGHHG
ncbi:nucleotidyltransferase dna polymerase for dna repair [Lacticaseibacillus sharpeae JCM 1186 = DSM 20505]|uniref:Nucleotidyltransferase dna polymerase for dna repair n=1 Tax=Lacticaseibacillus sharpeae JCM 1186 = DSM 20505 TaxID=1291052 RepID=A0A0R1ZJ44_9LACO|nr:nucleotidyltransferase dna polymerase for dna repair [Lacticaseibacillus sharpeae JCM 1186 = DSM 20505]